MINKPLILITLIGFSLASCDQSLNLSITSSTDTPNYCSPSPIVVSEGDEAVPIYKIKENCQTGDSLLLNYVEIGSVNYDSLSDYDYRPVSVINKVCDHSKEIVIVKVVDESDFTNVLSPAVYRVWDISCIYSGVKDYRGITELINE